MAFTLYNTNTIAIWDTTSEGPIQWIVGPESPGVQLDFSPDGKLLAAGGWDGKIRLWDVPTWEPLLNIAGGWFLRFSPNGQRLGCAADGIAGCYDVAPVRELTSFRDERQRPTDADLLMFNQRVLGKQHLRRARWLLSRGRVSEARTELRLSSEARLADRALAMLPPVIARAHSIQRHGVAQDISPAA